MLANREADGKPKDLAELQPSTGPSKSKNPIAFPAAQGEGIDRRLSNSHRKGVLEICKRENEIDEVRKVNENLGGSGGSGRG